MTRDELADRSSARCARPSRRTRAPPASARAGPSSPQRPSRPRARRAGAARLGRRGRAAPRARRHPARQRPGAGGRAARARHRQRADRRRRRRRRARAARRPAGCWSAAPTGCSSSPATAGARRLGRWDDATWSPAGLFVAATAGRTLAALDPATAPSAGACGRARPSASRAGRRTASTSPTAPAATFGSSTATAPTTSRRASRWRRSPPRWRPSELQTLAWAATDGTVTVENADTAKVFRTFRGRPRGPAARLVRRRPPAADRRSPQRHDPRPDDGYVETPRAPPRRTAARRRLRATGQPPRARGLPRRSHRAPRPRRDPPLRAGRLHDLEWSPDGRWLLASWPAAGQWLLARASGRPQETAISIEERFGSGARTHGWCC